MNKETDVPQQLQGARLYTSTTSRSNCMKNGMITELDNVIASKFNSLGVSNLELNLKDNNIIVESYSYVIWIFSL